MSRISPFHFNPNEYTNEELQNICPRYIKWTIKVNSFDFSKRKKATIDRSVPSFDFKYKLDDTSKAPKKSKSILSRIRKGGQNLKVRCKTSADLWRRWIRGGIMYNTELNERDEQELENKENETQSAVNTESEQKQTEAIIEADVLTQTTHEMPIEKKTEENAINIQSIDTKKTSEEKPEIVNEETIGSDSNIKININTNINTSMPEVVVNND